MTGLLVIVRHGHAWHPSRADIGRIGAAVFEITSDSIEETRPGGLATACADGFCVLYHKHCSTDGLNCLYEWGEVPAPTPPGEQPRLFFTTGVRIAATSKAGLGRAESALYLAAPRATQGRLPLSAFTQTQPEDSAPRCPKDRVVPDCPDLTTRAAVIRAWDLARP